MSRPVVCAAVVLLGCFLATLPAEPVSAPPADSRDFVFLASTRPVLLRVRVQIGGRPCTAPWEEFTRKLFAWLDRDGDGVLSKAEVERAPGAQFLFLHFQGTIGGRFQDQHLRLNDVDADKDGKVTPAELADHYSRSALGPIRIILPSSVEATAAVTDALFDRLDADKDGKLSAKELKNAAALLRPLDQDEDEMLTAAELTPGRGNRTLPPAPLDLADRVKANRKEPHPLIEIEPGKPADGVMQQVLAHNDGKLEAEELAGFLRRPPDVEFTARVGNVAPGDSVTGFLLRQVGEGMSLAGVQPLRIEAAKGGMRLPAAATCRLDPQTLNVSVGGSTLALYVSGDNESAMPVMKQFYLSQFRVAARKGVLERKQAAQVDFLNQLFDLIDRDGDGKLTEKELQGWLDLLEEGAGSIAVLTATDQGRSLFELLDADGDGRLSLRELGTAWSRLRPHARDGAGLAKSDIPRRVQVTLGLGRQAFPVPPRTAKPAASAPLWFRKMDRNNDGDVSPREFLGTPEDFARLDLDKDGLISADEARAAEERLEKK